MKFKEGDIVDHKIQLCLKGGEIIYILDTPSAYPYKVKWSDQSENWHAETALVLAVQPSSTIKTPCFEVGDEVQLNPDSKWNDGMDHNPLNCKGRVIRIENKSFPIVVVWEGLNLKAGYDPEDLFFWGMPAIPDQIQTTPELKPDTLPPPCHDDRPIDGAVVMDLVKRSIREN